MEVPIIPKGAEPKIQTDDPFLEMLPFLLSEAAPEQVEHVFTDLDFETQSTYLDLMQQRARLAEQGALPTGTNVAIFVSEVGRGDEVETFLGGVEEPLITTPYFVSEEETAEHMAAAQNIVHRIKMITADSVKADIQIASKESIDAAIGDSEVAHIIFIGHANSSVLAITPEDNYDWDDPKQGLDHLKLSFDVFGCGEHRDGEAHPRVGTTVTAPGGILYGVGKDYFEEGTPYDFEQLVKLPNGVLQGTPLVSLEAA